MKCTTSLIFTFLQQEGKSYYVGFLLLRQHLNRPVRDHLDRSRLAQPGPESSSQGKQWTLPPVLQCTARALCWQNYACCFKEVKHLPSGWESKELYTDASQFINTWRFPGLSCSFFSAFFVMACSDTLSQILINPVPVFFIYIFHKKTGHIVNASLWGVQLNMSCFHSTSRYKIWIEAYYIF